MAQPGRALALGARSRWFKSTYPDHFIVPLCNGSTEDFGSSSSRSNRDGTTNLEIT